MNECYNFKLPEGCTHYKQVGEYIRWYFAHFGNCRIFYCGRLEKYRIFRASYFVAPFHKTGWGVILAVHGNEVVNVEAMNDKDFISDAYHKSFRKVFSWPLPYDYKRFQELLQYFKEQELAPGYIPLKHY